MVIMLEISDIKSLFHSKENLIFLVGAGSSHDPPSNLPLGTQFVDGILELLCPDEELKIIRGMKYLRFEKIVEIFIDALRNGREFYNFFDLALFPNHQHYFFANMIENGFHVLTTNFDSLIEKAMLDSGIQKENINPIITRSDFDTFNNQEPLEVKKKRSLIKLHGSSKNIITNEDTRESIIATIRSLGRNKPGLDIFCVEPWKQFLLEKVSTNGILF